MNIEKSSKSEIKLFILLLMSIFPIITLGGFQMPVLYLFMPIASFIFLFVCFKWIKVPHVAKSIIIIFLFILVEIILSTLFASAYSGKLMLPTDMFQYIARLLCILCFIAIFYNSKIKATTFIKMFLLILLLAMMVGILQWIPWSGRELFVNLYPFRDGSEQLMQLNRELHTLRVHGFAQHATSNGGIATFSFVFAYSIFFHLKKYKILSILLMSASIVNIVASQARAGILALVFSLLAFYFIKTYIGKRPLKSTIGFIMAIVIIYLILNYLYTNGNLFVTQIVYRWMNLFSTEGGGRTEQISYGLSQLSSPVQYFFGISRAVQSNSEFIYHLEVEPINIFVLYGIIGFILQYSLVFYLLKYFFKNMKQISQNPEIISLLLASLVGLASYQVFSLGYFFFREIRIGLIPWILMGVTIGIIEREKISLSNASRNCSL